MGENHSLLCSDLVFWSAFSAMRALFWAAKMTFWARNASSSISTSSLFANFDSVASFEFSACAKRFFFDIFRDITAEP